MYILFLQNSCSMILVPNGISVMCVAIFEKSLYFTYTGDTIVISVQIHLALPRIRADTIFRMQKGFVKRRAAPRRLIHVQTNIPLRRVGKRRRCQFLTLFKFKMLMSDAATTPLPHNTILCIHAHVKYPYQFE